MFSNYILQVQICLIGWYALNIWKKLRKPVNMPAGNDDLYKVFSVRVN